MRNYKIYFCVVIVSILIFFITPFSTSFAKYVFNESILVANIYIDRTKPKLEITYSTKEITNGSVIVTITANEEIQEVEGWKLQEDKKTLVKEYKENTIEEIEIKDISDNSNIAQISIKNIDNEAPKIEIQSVSNTNENYPLYANKEDIITFTIKVTDNINILDGLDSDEIKILIGEKEINPTTKTLKIIKKESTEQIYELQVKGISDEGILKLKIEKDKVEDSANLKNEEVLYNTKILFDNTKPNVEYKQNKLEDGKVEAQVIANEDIRNLEGWQLTESTTLTKIFESNISYILRVYDLAGNSNSLEIDISDATNIILGYASHNSEIGWSFGYGNYDIAGKKALNISPIYKTEALAFSISGNISNDFLMARAFVHSYWGEGSEAQCMNSGEIYRYGENPSSNTWKTMSSANLVTLNDGKKYFQFGGSGINKVGITDINGNNPIPLECNGKYEYGVSGIQLKLKDESYYSIIYQIYVYEVGWVKPAKNGEIAMYNNDKPMSAIRIALVPNSELAYIYDQWNKDTGKTL